MKLEASSGDKTSLLLRGKKGTWQRGARGIFTFAVQISEGPVSGKWGKANIVSSETGIVCAFTKARKGTVAAKYLSFSTLWQDLFNQISYLSLAMGFQVLLSL